MNKFMETIRVIDAVKIFKEQKIIDHLNERANPPAMLGRIV